MEFTSPGLLGPAEKFRRRFAIPIERNSDADATEQLKRITGPFILRRLKTDKTVIADLPDKLEMKVWCNLTARAGLALPGHGGRHDGQDRGR